MTDRETTDRHRDLRWHKTFERRLESRAESGYGVLGARAASPSSWAVCENVISARTAFYTAHETRINNPNNFRSPVTMGQQEKRGTSWKNDLHNRLTWNLKKCQTIFSLRNPDTEKRLWRSSSVSRHFSSPLCNTDLASDLVSFAVTGQLSTLLMVKLSQLTLCIFIFTTASSQACNCSVLAIGIWLFLRAWPRSWALFP